MKIGIIGHCYCGKSKLIGALIAHIEEAGHSVVEIAKSSDNCVKDYGLKIESIIIDDLIDFDILTDLNDYHKSGWSKPIKINIPKFNLNKKGNVNIRNNLPRKFKP
jgi:hypothetical protein